MRPWDGHVRLMQLNRLLIIWRHQIFRRSCRGPLDKDGSFKQYCMADILRAVASGDLALLTLLDLQSFRVSIRSITWRTLLRRLEVSYGNGGTVHNYYYYHYYFIIIIIFFLLLLVLHYYYYYYYYTVVNTHLVFHVVKNRKSRDKFLNMLFDYLIIWFNQIFRLSCGVPTELTTGQRRQF